MTRAMARRDEVVKLRETDLNYAEIGRRLGISKQRAWQIVNGKPTVEKPDLRLKLMLTVGDVAQLLGLHANTVRRWSDTGIIKACRYGPRRDRRFRRENIDDFLKE